MGQVFQPARHPRSYFFIQITAFSRRMKQTHTTCCGLVLLASLWPSPNVARSDWLTHRGNPQRTGAADDLPGPKSPNVLWVHKTREHFVAAPGPRRERSLSLQSRSVQHVAVRRAGGGSGGARSVVIWSKSAPLPQAADGVAPALAGASSSSATACIRPTGPSCTVSKPREDFRSGS